MFVDPTPECGLRTGVFCISLYTSTIPKQDVRGPMSFMEIFAGSIEYRIGRGLPAHLPGGWKDFKGRTKLSAEDGEKLSIKERCQLEG